MAKLEVDFTPETLLQPFRTEDFGLFVAYEWKRLIDPYTPMDSGMLKNNFTIRPFEIEYNSPYAHYLYEGILYVDPDYGVGAFYSPEYGFWSRPNVTKIPSDRKLNYSHNASPFATDHWDKRAEKAGQKDKLIQSIDNWLVNYK